MNSVDISVIVPIYGVERYIERCLRSLFAQSKIGGVEFILVNDATTDNSIDIVQKVIPEYDNIDVQLINHCVNRGLASARQSGVDIAKGEYIIHIDSDDWCEPTMLDEMYKVAKKEDAAMVICDYFITSDNGDKYVKQKVVNDPIECYNMILHGSLAPSVWNKMFKRSLYIDDDIRSIDGINMGEDQILSALLFCKGRPSVAYCPNAFYHYCLRGDSYMSVVQDKYLQESILGTNIIEQIIKDENLSDRFNDGLIVKKLRVKLKCLLNSNGDRQREYATIYPETNEYIYSHTPAKKIYKIALKQSIDGRVWIFNLIITTMRFIKKIIR